MIDLSEERPQEPYDLDLVPGISVTVRPVRRRDMAIAKAVASGRLREIRKQFEEIRDAGYPLGDMPDFDELGVEDGVYDDLLVKELAWRHIVAWEGATFGDGPADLTRENVTAFMDIQVLSEQFYTKLMIRQAELDLAKKESRPLPNGSSGLAAAARTVEPAANPPPPAPVASGEKTASSAPMSSTPHGPPTK